MANVGSILSGAFGLLARRPAAIAIWALTYVLGSMLIGLAFGFIVTGTFSLAPAAPYTAPPTTPGMIGGFFLVYLLFLLLMVVVLNAIHRAVLWPDDRGFASMRLGMDELRVLGLLILIAILGFAMTFIVQLLLVFFVSLIGFATGNPAVAGIVSMLLFLAYFLALIWVAVRLSPMLPLTLYRHRISVDGAWELSRGRFWTLFGAYFIIGLITFAVGLLLMWGVAGSYWAEMLRAGGDPERMQIAAARFAQAQLEMPVATRIGYTVVGSALAAILFTLWAGVVASATRALLIEKEAQLHDLDEAGAGDPSETEIY